MTKEELEAEIERLKGDLELWESGACRATNLDKCGVVKELEAQIEKMKGLLEKWYNQHSDKTYTETFYEELIKATEGFLWTDIRR